MPSPAEVRFLYAEVLTGLTTAKIALTTKSTEKKERNRAMARRAYDTVLRFVPKTYVTDSEAADLREKLEQLKADLRALGEDV